MAAGVRGLADRVEHLLASFDSAQTPRRARDQAENLVRAVVDFYGEALERILTIVHDEAGERSDAMFALLCDDKFVESLLCLHGLHPVALVERVNAALSSVLPYIKSHEGNMEISRIEDDVVWLRLEGTCSGCPASSATLKLAVERAILERVPEIREVRAEEAPAMAVREPLVAESSLRVLSKA